MKHLSLFTGAGGGELGARLNGWETIGYVEIDDYCRKVLGRRIRDGVLPNAPIYTDIRTFNRYFAALYLGVVEIISAGFPCQPFSVAGNQLGEDDSRNMWPETIRTIRLVRPRYCLLENVPGLLNSGYCQRIFGDLAEAGYDARWKVISAAEVGAPHKRDRLWIMAVSDKCNDRRDDNRRTVSSATSQIEREEQGENRERVWPRLSNGCENVADTEMRRRYVRPTPEPRKHQGWEQIGGCGSTIPDAPEQGLEGDESEVQSRKHNGLSSECDWWSVEPDVGRVANGVASRVDRLRAIGNGQVPAVVRTAWELLR